MAQIMARHGVRSTGAVVLATPSGRRANPGKPVIPHNQEVSMGGVMAKFHSRPSNQYRYEHYDPKA